MVVSVAVVAVAVAGTNKECILSTLCGHRRTLRASGVKLWWVHPAAGRVGGPGEEEEEEEEEKVGSFLFALSLKSSSGGVYPALDRSSGASIRACSRASRTSWRRAWHLCSSPEQCPPPHSLYHQTLPAGRAPPLTQSQAAAVTLLVVALVVVVVVVTVLTVALLLSCPAPARLAPLRVITTLT